MLELLTGFGERTILVFGDIMLDRYWMGAVERISPEAPVPVVSLEDEHLVLGGAANVAANISGLGADVHLAGYVGTDPESHSIREMLAGASINDTFVKSISERPTTTKSRLLAGSHQIARMDREVTFDISEKETDSLIDAFASNGIDFNAVIVSDYGKGMVSAYSSARVIEFAREKGIPVIVDPKGIDFKKYSGANVVTPNRKEAGELFKAAEKRAGSVNEAGKYILENFGIETVLITMGPDGIALFAKDCEPVEIPAAARNVFDVTGAGDTVIGTLALALAAGATINEASILANAAAGAVVETIGTTPISIETLKAVLGNNGELNVV